MFDMDGVLVDSGAFHRAAWHALLEELGVPPPPEFWRRTIGRPAHEAIAWLLGCDLTAPQARELSRRKHEHYIRLSGTLPTAIPGALAFVDELCRHGVPAAVATSARRADATRVLGGLGLLSRFKIIVTAEDVTRGKPDPEVYKVTARRLDVSPARCLVFEDSIVGVKAACHAGMRVIGITTAHTEAELLDAGAEGVMANFEACQWPLSARR